MSYEAHKSAAEIIADRPRRAWAKWVVGAGVLFSGATAIAVAVFPAIAPKIVPAVPLIVAVGSCVVSPFSSGVSLSSRGWHACDEFHHNTLADASRRALAVLVFFILALSTWAWTASQFDWIIPITLRGWSVIGFAVCGMAIALPVLFAELMIPMPPAGDEGED